MPPTQDPLFCPQCGGEYLATALECADCRIPLVHELAEVEELPLVDELTCVRAASIGWAQQLSGRLAEAGISHRIQVVDDDGQEDVRRTPNQRLPFGVYVLEADLAAARGIDEEHMRGEIPDLPDELDAPPGEGCPACGADFAADAAECPDCGLALGIG